MWQLGAPRDVEGVGHDFGGRQGCQEICKGHERCLKPLGSTLGSTSVDLGRPNRLFLGQ